MTKWLLLMRIQLLGLFDINRVMHTNDKREKRRLVMVGAVILFVVAIMAFYSTGMAVMAAYLGLAEVLPPLILVVCAASTLVVTFVKTGGVLFGFRDYDLVMSLPVRSADVIASRLVFVYAMNLLIAGIIMLPSVIVFGAAVNAAPQVWCMLIASLFIAPLLPMVVSMALVALIMAAASRFRYKNIAVILLSTAAILALMSVSFALPQGEGTFTEMAEGAALTVYGIYPPARWYAGALFENDLSAYALFALVSVGSAALFVALLAVFYKKINTVLAAVRMRGNYRLGALKSSTQFMALYKKELRRFISSPTYVLNTSIGAVLMLAASATLMFADFEQAAELLEIPDFAPMASAAAPWIPLFFLAISSATTSALSLEGRSRWLMCSAPVPTGAVFDAKIALSLSYLVPASLLSAVMLSLGLRTGLRETLALFVMPLIFSVYITVVGLAFNVKFPKYNWTNEVEAIKQSMSVFASMAAGVGSVVACVVVASLTGNPALGYALTGALLLGASAFIYRRLVALRLYM
jgi:ABC-2 type transport system permease protein